MWANSCQTTVEATPLLPLLASAKTWKDVQSATTPQVCAAANRNTVLCRHFQDVELQLSPTVSNSRKQARQSSPLQCSTAVKCI